jgi:hypothetical protein
MLKWQEVDRAMVSYGWPKNLDRRLKIISVIFLLLEAGTTAAKKFEPSLSVISKKKKKET